MQDVPNLTARQLRAVLAVAEYRSFVAASVALNMSQPGLTRLVRSVESELGVNLFDRNTRRVAISPAGREFVALAQRVVDDIRLGVASLRDSDQHLTGQVIVSSVISLAETGSSLIKRFKDDYPCVELHLREGLQNDVIEEVKAGLADVGIAYIDGLPQTFVTQPLGLERLYLIVPSDSDIRGEVAMNDLAELPLVSFPRESRTRQAIDRAAATAGCALRYVLTTNRLATLLELVRQGVGVAVVPSSERPGNAKPGLRSLPLAASGTSVQLGLLQLRGRLQSPAGSSLVRLMQDWETGREIEGN